MIKFEENRIDVEEYNYLYDAVGWGHYEKELVVRDINIRTVAGRTHKYRV